MMRLAGIRIGESECEDQGLFSSHGLVWLWGIIAGKYWNWVGRYFDTQRCRCVSSNFTYWGGWSLVGFLRTA